MLNMVLFLPGLNDFGEKWAMLPRMNTILLGQTIINVVTLYFETKANVSQWNTKILKGGEKK